MRRISWLFLGATNVAFAATPVASSSTHWTWRSLRRPLHIPQIPPGSPCRVSAPTSVSLGAEGVKTVPGRGPAYPSLGLGTTFDFVYPPLPPSEIRIRPGHGVRTRASYTRLRAAGCFAYQIDGTSFSRVIVFDARFVPPQ
jgi:hypothetical protein